MYSLIRHGRRRSIELKKWRHFRVSVENASSLSHSFSSVATAANVIPKDIGKGNNFTVSYLVDSLGFTTKLAVSISRKVSFEDKANPDSVLKLLRSYGFTESLTSTIITNYPRLLMLDAEKSIAPKLKYLQSRGASSSEVAEIVSNVPKILGKKEGKSISRYYDFVKAIIEADKSLKLGKFCHSLPEGSKQENKIRNLLVLRDLGMSQKMLFSLLISDYRFVCGKEKFRESLKKVVEMGFDPTTSKFVQAFKVVYSFSDKVIEEKVNAYKRLGFAVEDVWEMFKKFPAFLNSSEKKISQRFETLKNCGLLEDQVLSVIKKCPQCINLSEQKIMNSTETFLGLGFSREEFVMMVNIHPGCLCLSVETMKKKTEFVVKKMNWPLKAVVSYPLVLGNSMEKRIVPRCNVIKVLISKGLLGDKGSELPPIQSVLNGTDQVFLKRYVTKHEELVPELMAIFNGGRVI